MSRIDKLVAEHCSEGVRFDAIGQLADVTSGATPSKSVPQYWTDGSIPWLSSGEVNKGTIYEADTFITQAGLDSCSTRMMPSGSVVMALAGQGKTRGMVARTRLACCTNQSLATIVPKSGLDSDYLFHYLKTQYYKLRDVSSGDGTRGGLNLAMIRAYRIPVPPLEVQREVVRILNAFMELESELETELESRRRQYDHYRDEILRGFRGDGEVVRLEQVANILVGFPFKSAQFSDDAEGTTLVRGDNIAQGTLKSREFKRWARKVDDGLARFELQRDDIVLAMDRPWIPAGLKWAVVSEDVLPALLVQRVARLRASTDAIDQRFLGLIIASAAFTKHVLGVQSGNTVPHISSAQIGAFKFPLPPLREQARIGAALADLEILVKDLNVGLPAELAARRKQYEYYRDRLLTFEELSA